MLKINGNRLIPAPFITFTKDINTVGDTRPISSNYTIVLNGTLLPSKGSPSSTGSFFTASNGYPTDENITDATDKFDSILAKQEALRELFAQPGLFFEYGADDSLSTAVSGRIRLNSINFEPGAWVDRCNYTITLGADSLNRLTTPTGEDRFDAFTDYYLTQASDDIQITESENGDNLIGITRNINAVGKSIYTATGILRDGKAGWEYAKEWCLGLLNSETISHLIHVTGLYQYNKRSVENINKYAGSYGITQTYSVVSGNAPYIHTYSVQDSISVSQIDDIDSGQLRTQTVQINGNIVGLYATGNYGPDRLSVALSGFDIIEPSIPHFAGVGSGFLYTNRNVVKNNNNGTVEYTYLYTNYPTGNTYSHIYTILDNDSSNTQSIASINGNIKFNSVSGVATGMFTSAKSFLGSNILPTLKSKIEGVVGYNVLAEPSQLSITYNKSNGEINYSASYIGIDDYNTNTQKYIDQFEVSLSDQASSYPVSVNNLATVTVAGSIIGLCATGTSAERYNRAATGWNIVKSDLKNRAMIATTGIADRLVSRAESYNKVNGTITYNYVFSTRTDLTTAGIIAEEINVDTALPRDIFAVQIIPGVNTGPILQNLNAQSEGRVTVTAEFVLDKGVATSTAESRFTAISGMYAPTGTIFRDSNTVSNNIYNGRYVRSASWIYR